MGKVIRLTETDLVRLVKKVIEEQEEPSNPTKDEYIIQPMLNRGYQIVKELSLADGDYNVKGSGSVLCLYQNGKDTGYCIVATNGIRGAWSDNTKVRVTNKTVQLPTIINTGKVYRILFKQPEQTQN